MDGCCLPTVATFSGEVELCALVRAAAEGFGFHLLATDFGFWPKSAFVGGLVGREVYRVQKRAWQD